LKKSQIAVLALLALAAAITVGCGSSSNPTFSKMPMWSSRNEGAGTFMYTMGLDGSSPSAVTTDNSSVLGTSISANTKTVEYTANGQVWVASSDGTNPKQLTNNDTNTTYVFSARLSPNGKKIVYAVLDPNNDYLGTLWVINTDGSGNANVTATLPSGMTSCYSASFSPDSSKIVFACFGDTSFGLFTMKADGTHVATVLTQGSPIDSPAYTPTGKQFVYVTYGVPGAAPTLKSRPNHVPVARGNFGHYSQRAHSYGISEFLNQGIASVNLDGSNPTLIVPDPSTSAPIYETEVFNSNLYYEVYDSNLGLYQIYKANVDGTGGASISDGTAEDELGVCGYCF
jgi:Tol biopolymer transport system component